MNQVAKLDLDVVLDEEGTWKRVIYADDCEPCEMCGEPVCDLCDDHYADCECPGPTQDEMIYKEFNGVMYAQEEPPPPTRRENDVN